MAFSGRVQTCKSKARSDNTLQTGGLDCAFLFAREACDSMHAIDYIDNHRPAPAASGKLDGPERGRQGPVQELRQLVGERTAKPAAQSLTLADAVPVRLRVRELRAGGHSVAGGLQGFSGRCRTSQLNKNWLQPIQA